MDDKIQEYAQKIYDKLVTLPVGTETCVSDLALVVGIDGFDAYCMWLPVLHELDDIIQREGKYRIDYTKYEGCRVGMPYDIPFVFMKKGQSIHEKETGAARAFAKAHGIYGFRYACYYNGDWVFEEKYPPGIVVDLAYTPYIIVNDKLEVREVSKEECIEISNWRTRRTSEGYDFNKL